MHTRKSLVALLTLSLLTCALLSTSLPRSSAASGVTDNLIFHEVSSSYTVGSIATSGHIMNSTTTLAGSSTAIGNTSDGKLVANFILSSPMAGAGATVSGNPLISLDLLASAASNWNYSVALSIRTTSGTLVGSALSASSCATPSSCLSLTTSQHVYSWSMAGVSATPIPSGDVLNMSVDVYQCTGASCAATTATTTHLYVESSGTLSELGLPLSASPITFNSMTSSQATVDPNTSPTDTFTLSASDAFGLYDLASSPTITITAGSTSPVSAATMTASGSNTPTGYTGTWTYTVQPSMIASGNTGNWVATSTATDNTGNTATSPSASFVYQLSGGYGGPITTATTSSAAAGGQIVIPLISAPAPQGLTLLELIGVTIVVLVIAITAIIVVKRR